jgi:hypothetical protein
VMAKERQRNDAKFDFLFGGPHGGAVHVEYSCPK